MPTVANWRLSTVPRYLAPKEVKRVLKACDLGTAIGRRNYAILLLLARLGLRAGEVVALQLEDINWRAGEILVRGKGLLHDRMPLPADVGKALASYLRRDRPRVPNTPSVRSHEGATPRALLSSSTAVSTIVRSALGRANLHPKLKGAHLLRHSLATSMLACRGNDGRNRRSSSASIPEHNGNLRQGRLRGPALAGSSLADGRCTVKRLEQALNDYLCIRRGLGFQLQEEESSVRNFVAFVQAERASYITRNWRFAGPRGPRKPNLLPGLSVSAWSGASPSGIALLTHAPRFLPQDFSRIVTGESPLTSTAMKRLKGFFAEPNNFPLPRDSAPTPIRPFLACWWRPECG